MSNTLPPIIFWDGISALSRQNDPLNIAACEWVKKIVESQIPIYLHLILPGIIESDSNDIENIVIAFSFSISSESSTLILIVSKKFSPLLFVHEPFTQLREYLEDRKYIKYVLNVKEAQKTFNTIRDHFKIIVNPFKCVLDESHMWSEYIYNESVQKIFQNELSIFKGQIDMDGFKSSIFNLSVTISNPMFLSKDEKAVFIALFKILFAIMADKVNSSAIN